MQQTPDTSVIFCYPSNDRCKYGKSPSNRKQQACAITKQPQQFVCGLWAAGWPQWHLPRSLVNNGGCSALGFVISGEVCLFRPCKLGRSANHSCSSNVQSATHQWVWAVLEHVLPSALINQWDLEHLWSQLYMFFCVLSPGNHANSCTPQIDKNNEIKQKQTTNYQTYSCVAHLFVGLPMFTFV